MGLDGERESLSACASLPQASYEARRRRTVSGEMGVGENLLAPTSSLWFCTVLATIGIVGIVIVILGVIGSNRRQFSGSRRHRNRSASERADC
jgi:hypothetical protein